MATTPIKVIQTYQGDTAPDITFNISRDDGTIVNLTGATVTFIIQDPVTKLSTNDPYGSITNVCQITNATGGICVYSWNAGGTDTPHTGFYPANLKIAYPTGTVETYSMTVAVDSALVS